MHTIPSWGLALAEIRHELNLKAAPLARCLGVSESTFSRLEHGITKITMEQCQRICDAMHYPMLKLIERAETMAEHRPELPVAPVKIRDPKIQMLSSRDPDSLIDNTGASVFLDISKKTLARRVKNKLIPVVRVAGKLHYRTDDVLELSRKYRA